MPRVSIRKQDYMVRDLGNWITMWLKRTGKYMKDLAAELGVTPQGMTFKAKNGVFTLSDLIIIFDFCEVPDDEILKVLKLKEGGNHR